MGLDIEGGSVAVGVQVRDSPAQCNGELYGGEGGSMSDQEGDSTTFSIEGGVGSISYTLAEIAGVGDHLGSLAHLMIPLVNSLQAEWAWLVGVTTAALPYPYGPVDAVRNSVWTAGRAQVDIAALARKAQLAKANYEAAEAHNVAVVARMGRIDALRQGLNAWSLGPFAPLGVAADVSALLRQPGAGLRDVMEKILNNGGGYAAGLLGPGYAMAYLLSQIRRQGQPGVIPAVVLRKFFDEAGLAQPGKVAVRAVPAQEWDPEEPYFPPGHASSAEGTSWKLRASIEGLLAGSSDAYKYPPGSIGVVRIERPDGSNVWVVHLPGTEDWSTVDSTNPFDMEGNMEGLTAAQREAFEQQEVVVQQLIKEALRASGALPGEDVLLTGHSGGGIHAAAAAADPTFRAEVNVKMIVIAGSPARNADVPEGIAVVDLENEHDIVTAGDYGPPEAAPNWVTVTSHRPPMAEGGDLGEVIEQAHSLDNYLLDAAALDQSDNPAVEASRDTLRTILGAGVGGAAVAGTKWVYQGRDVKDQSKPAPKPIPMPKPTRRSIKPTRLA